MALWMLVTFHLWAALHAVLNSEQPDPEFIPFCDAVSHNVYDGLYTHHQAYNCMFASERSDRRMPLTILVMEALPVPVPGQPEYLYSKYLGISLNPVSVHCESGIWDETKGGQVTKALITAVNNPLEELSSRHHYYNDFPDLAECYFLPPIIFYSIPDVTVSMDSEANSDSLNLICQIINVAPVQNLTVRWLRGDQIKSSVSLRELAIHDSRMAQFNVSDSMTVPLNKEENGEIYTCQAELNLEPYDIIRRNYSIRIPAQPLLDSEQRDFDFALFCEMDPIALESKWKDTPHYNINQAYICGAASDHSGKRMHFFIYHVEVTPGQAERFAVCPLADSYHNSIKKLNDPGSQRCDTNIRRAWDKLWNETREGFLMGMLLTIVNGTLKDWSTKRQCYTDRSTLTKCYVLPPIVFYEIPDVRAYVEPESGPMLAGNRYSLVCDIVNVAPMHKLTVKWLRGNEIIRSVSYRDRSLDDIDVTLHNISDSLTIWASGAENSQIYTCQAELNLEPFDVFLRNSSMNITVEFSGSSPIPGSSAGPVAVILACVIVLLVVLILVLNRKKLGQHSCKG